MKINFTKLDEKLSVTGQISINDITEIAASGFKSIICNRPDGESGLDQPASGQLENTANSLGVRFAYLPVELGAVSVEHGAAFKKLIAELPGPILAFCRTGKRAAALYTLAKQTSPDGRQAETQAVTSACDWSNAYDVVVIGGGSAGIGVTASLLQRRPSLRIAIVEPSSKHYYQPAWTLVGGGAFDVTKTVRSMSEVIPRGAQWIQATASSFDPDSNLVHLTDGRAIGYEQLIVCPGLRLAWERIEGLEETLGKNGVTSNYRFDLASYTWSLVQNLKGGKALFTQPPMPIKCAGAPQKAMYLSCDHWLRNQSLNTTEVEFNSAGGVLFGVADFVPSLMEYVKRYNINLVFNSNLVKVDGANKVAYFDVKDGDGVVTRVGKSFDMLHVAPPQLAPDFISHSLLADAAGWCEVDQKTLRHSRYPNIFSLGDVCSSPNAKTAAAVRKQIVVVAENLLAAKEGRDLATSYDGYGSCPLTVEKGKVILAEFGFGGKLLPTFPLDPTVSRYTAWILKARFLPWLYWNGMLKGREWLARSSRPD